MKWKLIVKLVSSLNLVVGATMIVPVLISFLAGQDDWASFLIALAISLGASGVGYLVTRNASSDLSHRDAFVVVTLAWVSVCFFAALPFWLSGLFGGFTNAMFESISGFTTTGSTILTDIESIPLGLLFWRSIIQWYGGMGIIVLSLAILPVLGVGGMQIFKAEVPGPTADKLQPRMRDTAMLLWKVYVLFTALETLLLWVGGMSFFDALCHSFTTLATGGFGTKADSFMSMTPYLDMVATVFMIAAGVNFSLHYLLLKGRIKQVLADGELRAYLTIILISTLLLAAVLRGSGTYDSIWQSLRYSVFQTATLITTTGYNSADFEAWGATAPFAPVIAFMLMFIGGMAGSTGGGMKVVRVWLVLKHGYRELFRLIHPRAIKHVKVGNKVVSENVLDAVIGFIVLYVALALLATLIVSMFGHDFVTSFSSVAATLGNIGPGLGEVGPTDNFNFFQTPVKWLLMACMLLGRLEIYTVLLLVVPEFWRK